MIITHYHYCLLFKLARVDLRVCGLVIEFCARMVL